MTDSGCDFLQTSASLVERTLERDLPAIDEPPQRLHEAMRYAVLGPGKRLRAALVRAAALACGPEPVTCGAAMQAVELLHAYTLVHDDLPAMDDDDLRRGRPACHRAFDEATAILVGDALQAEAFLRLSDCGTAAIRCLGRAAGSRGVVGGQAEECDWQGDPTAKPDRARLRRIHQRKTATLIRAACELGGICAGATTAHRHRLTAYGTAIGLAFQIVDDLLDADEDRRDKRPSWVTLAGAEAARAQARQLHDEAVAALAGLPGTTDHLRELATRMVERDH